MYGMSFCVCWRARRIGDEFMVIEEAGVQRFDLKVSSVHRLKIHPRGNAFYPHRLRLSLMISTLMKLLPVQSFRR